MNDVCWPWLSQGCDDGWKNHAMKWSHVYYVHLFLDPVWKNGLSPPGRKKMAWHRINWFWFTLNGKVGRTIFINIYYHAQHEFGLTFSLIWYSMYGLMECRRRCLQVNCFWNEAIFWVYCCVPSPRFHFRYFFVRLTEYSFVYFLYFRGNWWFMLCTGLCKEDCGAVLLFFCLNVVFVVG